MPTATGTVPTTRAERYLGQLCDHLGQLGHGHGHGSGPLVGRVERSGDRAEIEVGPCVLELTATPTELVVVVCADDDEAVARGRELVQHRIETIGRRDGLTLTWSATA